MRGAETRGSIPILGSILCAAVVAVGAVGAAATERPDAESGYAYAARAMSSHGAASSDPARSKAEIEAWHYNSDYLFGLSRGTADSALLPAFKPLVFLLTVPLDIALLPIAAIGGLFG